MGSGGIAPPFLTSTLDINEWVSFIPLQNYAWGNCPWMLWRGEIFLAPAKNRIFSKDLQVRYR
jgi:hypothetical protein